MTSKKRSQIIVTIDVLTVLGRVGAEGATVSYIHEGTGYSKERIKTVLKELKSISLTRQYRGKWFIETSFSFDCLFLALKFCAPPELQEQKHCTDCGAIFTNPKNDICDTCQAEFDYAMSKGKI